MATRILIRGDSYALRRPIYRIELFDINGDPFDLAGCTIRTTYKTNITTPSEDPTDAAAQVAHTLILDGGGVPEYQNGLALETNAQGGVVLERFTADETLALPTNTVLYSDVELTDANGEVFTWVMTEGIVFEDAYTNRTTG